MITILPRCTTLRCPIRVANATNLFSTSSSSVNPLTLMTSNDPKSRAALSMATAMALHFFGYEFARGSNMALFTSSSFGFGEHSGSHYTLAMTFVSPVSLMLLLGYGRLLNTLGPRKALRNSTAFCLTVLALFGFAISAIINNATSGIRNPTYLGKWTLSQWVVWTSFVFQNSYATLLYAQQWSFLGSIFTPSQASKYYGYVAGLSSIASMTAGSSLSRLVTWCGLPGLLGLAAISLSGTLILADWAYSLAEMNGFDPSLELQKNGKSRNRNQSTTTPSGDEQKTSKIRSLLHQIREGISLFQRVPTLGALFCETITFQSLCTILSTSLVIQLKDAVPIDSQRAAWTGRFYACTNGLSTLFQFFLMPTLTQKIEPKLLWKWMPLLPLGCAIIQMLPTSILSNIRSSSTSIGLYLVAVSFLTTKTLDYSLRNVLAEFVYVPLDFDSRYVGKEVIAVFANRFGKSGMAMMLSALQFLLRSAGSSGNGLLPGMALLLSFGWWASAVSLSLLLLGRDDAERVVAERIHSRGADDDKSARREHEKES